MLFTCWIRRYFCQKNRDSYHMNNKLYDHQSYHHSNHEEYYPLRSNQCYRAGHCFRQLSQLSYRVYDYLHHVLNVLYHIVAMICLPCETLLISCCSICMWHSPSFLSFEPMLCYMVSSNEVAIVKHKHLVLPRGSLSPYCEELLLQWESPTALKHVFHDLYS